MLHTKFQGHRSCGSSDRRFFKVFTILPYTMLHTKFQGHRSCGSSEEDFLRFLPYMGMAAMLVM